MRMCLNWYSTSPRTRLEGTRRMKSRTSSAERASSRSPWPPKSTSPPRQNARPTTEASRMTARAALGRASRRAAMAALTVVGRSEPNDCPSMNAAVSSSTKRISLGGLGYSLDGLSGEVKVCKQRLRERGGVSVGQGLEADRRMREESASPTGSVIEELGPGEADHHDRYVSGMSRQIFDEGQKARIRPMQVFEDE